MRLMVNAKPKKSTSLLSKRVGYARVSTEDQDIALQLDALEEAGCHRQDIFVDKASGAKADRPGLDACLAAINPGDTLIVWRLDRLGRSMPHLVSLVTDLLGPAGAFEQKPTVMKKYCWYSMG
jgi:predicted site-specific integrase-resolvase